VTAEQLKKKVRHIPDFPKKGILFYDITTLLRDPAGFHAAVDSLSSPFLNDGIDLVVGIESNGIHSNGLTLARRALGVIGNSSRLTEYSPELGCTLGEELLRPTNIYVSEILAMLEGDVAIKALIHITGDGFLNLARVSSETGFVIERPLNPSPIFSMIREAGNIDDLEMFRVFNMGTGFCVITAPGDASRAEQIVAEHGHRASVIGYTVRDPERRVWIPSRNLVGSKHAFRTTSEKAPDCPSPPR